MTASGCGDLSRDEAPRSQLNPAPTASRTNDAATDTTPHCPGVLGISDEIRSQMKLLKLDALPNIDLTLGPSPAALNDAAAAQRKYGWRCIHQPSRYTSVAPNSA